MNLSLDFKFGKYIIPRNFIIYQGKNFFAMVPPNPILKGHILICSKREVPSISDLSNEEIFDFSLTLQYLSKKLEQYYKVNSNNISIQDGIDSGQTINHFHAHIIPRIKGDFENGDDIYNKICAFDEEFKKKFNDFINDENKKLEVKEEIENFNNFILKSFI